MQELTKLKQAAERGTQFLMGLHTIPRFEFGQRHFRYTTTVSESTMSSPPSVAAIKINNKATPVGTFLNSGIRNAILQGEYVDFHDLLYKDENQQY